MSPMNRSNSGFEPEIHGIDEKLASAAQKQVRDAVRNLPEEPLSMAWRSQLNEQIVAVTVKKQRVQLFGWIWKPAAGLAVACSLAVLFVWRTQPTNFVQPSRNDSGIEAALMAAHQESTVMSYVVGPGLAARDPETAQKLNLTREDDWSEVDFNSL